jgi:hypothetical protein
MKRHLAHSIYRHFFPFSRLLCTLLLFSLYPLYQTLCAQGVSDYFFRQKDCVQEKLYLTTDRPYYEPGDTVWFRGTLVAADNLSYLIHTNYIYVELITPQGEVLMRRKVRRQGLCFHHDLPLDSTWHGGRYLLRAYTSWMRNFDADNFYQGTLNIVAPDEQTANTSRQTTAHDFDVTFLPEGGSRVAGCRQKIAFRAVSDEGRPVQVRGTVHAVGSSMPLAVCESRHDGMGWFWLEGTDNRSDLTLEVTVTAPELTDSTGLPMTRTWQLPKATGRWALQVETSEMDATGEVRYQVLHSAESDATTERHHDTTDTLWLLLHSGSNLLELRPVVAGESGVMEVRRCRAGVSQMVLCTAEGIGLSRRLLFRLPTKGQQPQLAAQVESPEGARQEANFQLTLSDAEGHPLRGDFAVSLLDAAFVDPTAADEDQTLVSNLLLCSDLHGYINRSAYYTDPQEPRAERLEALECVLLTHGWSRFSTDTMRVVDTPVLPHPLESNEWISGYVDRFFKRKDRKDTENIAISIVDTAGGSWGTAMLDSTGHFFVGNLDYPNKMPLQVRLLSYSANPHYHFDRISFPEVVLDRRLTSWRSLVMATDAERDYREWLASLQSRTTRLLGDVVITDRRPGNGKVRYQRKFDAAEIDQEVDLYNAPLAIDVVNELLRSKGLNYMEEYGREFEEPTADFTLLMGFPTSEPIMTDLPSVHEKKATIRLRGVTNSRLYSTVEALSNLYSGDLLSVEFLQRDTAYIILTFKPGTTITSVRPDRRRVTHYAFGYTEPEYFYHPRYESRAEREDPHPDLRKTLSWFPSIQSDEQGAIGIRFFTSDHPTKHYLLRVEGVTFSGQPVSLQCEIP